MTSSSGLTSSLEDIKAIEKAGVADAGAIELNIFALPSDTKRSVTEYEQLYFDIIKAVKAETSNERFNDFCDKSMNLLSL